MSILGRRRRTAALPRPAVAGWHPDGTGMMSNGQCGGDQQAGGSCSVRFIRDDMPGSLVTIKFYAGEHCEAAGGYTVEQEVEWVVCGDPADPGGTEIWSDVQYDSTSLPEWASLAIADAEARRNAGIALACGAEDIGWNGRPFRNGD